jgi:tetratricopeptide (TPR) repeat protein
MKFRVLVLAALAVIALGVGFEIWWQLGAGAPGREGADEVAAPAAQPPLSAEAPKAVPAEAPAAPSPTPSPIGADGLPLPPAPPRIAQGAEYERCLGMLKEDPAGAQAYAEAWEATGGKDGAVHCRAAALIALGRLAQGAEMLERLARESAGPTAARAAIYAQATQAWLLAGDAQRAFASATLALALSPDDLDMMIDRSIAAATMERYLDAIDDLNAVLDRDPKRADALVFRAAAWRHAGQLGLAHDDVSRALAVDPDNAEALLERGIIRQRRGDLAGARADWQRVLDLAPDSASADFAQQNLSLLEAGPARR